MNWFRKLTGPSRIARVEASLANARKDIDIAHRAAAIARLETAQVRNSLHEWQKYCAEQTKLVMTLLREVDACKVAAASKPAGYDARLARLELHFMAPVSDGVAEVDAQAKAALSDALVGLSKGSA